MQYTICRHCGVPMIVFSKSGGDSMLMAVADCPMSFSGGYVVCGDPECRESELERRVKIRGTIRSANSGDWWKDRT